MQNNKWIQPKITSNTQDKVNVMLGKNITRTPSFRDVNKQNITRVPPLVNTNKQYDASEVIMKVRKMLEKMSEVEKAKGTITLKLKNRAPRTLSFNYQ